MGTEHVESDDEYEYEYDEKKTEVGSAVKFQQPTLFICSCLVISYIFRADLSH
jgi:hypothetical protein